MQKGVLSTALFVFSIGMAIALLFLPSFIIHVFVPVLNFLGDVLGR